MKIIVDKKIETLISIIVKGHELPSINPIVDLGNDLSLKYCIPLGAHDIDKFRGNIELRYACEDDVIRLRDVLANILETKIGAQVSIGYVDKDNNEYEILSRWNI